MKKIIENDKDSTIDELIQEVFERKEILQDIDSQVMNSIRRDARKAWVRRWGKAVAFSFGLPLLAVFLGIILYHFATLHDSSPLVEVSVLISAVSSAILIYHLTYSFRLED